MQHTVFTEKVSKIVLYESHDKGLWTRDRVISCPFSTTELIEYICIHRTDRVHKNEKLSIMINFNVTKKNRQEHNPH